MRPAFVLVAVLFVALFFVACGDEGELETGEGRKSGDMGTRRSGAAACKTSEPQDEHFHFAPKTHREGERVVLPLVFHDETTAELIYPPELDVAGLGATPYGSARLSGESSSAERGDVVGRDFWIFYGEVEKVLATLNGGCRPALLAEYQGRRGSPSVFGSSARTTKRTTSPSSSDAGPCSSTTTRRTAPCPVPP